MSGMDQKFAKLAADDGQRLNSNVQPGVIVHRPLIMRGCIKNSQKLDEHRFGALQVPHSLI